MLGLHAEQGNLSAIPTPESVTSFGNERSEVQHCTGKATVDMQMGQWPVIDLESVQENLEFCEGWLHLALEIGFELSTRTSEHTNLMLGLASAYHLGHACCHGLIPRSGGGKSNQARVEVGGTIQITTPARLRIPAAGRDNYQKLVSRIIVAATEEELRVQLHGRNRSAEEMIAWARSQMESIDLFQRACWKAFWEIQPWAP